jgi:hypothetical protein
MKRFDQFVVQNVRSNTGKSVTSHRTTRDIRRNMTWNTRIAPLLGVGKIGNCKKRYSDNRNHNVFSHDFFLNDFE